MEPRRQKLAVALAVVVVMVAAGVLLFQQIPETVSAPLFLVVVILEVIVAPVPGGAIAYLGAARFGFWEAWPLLYAGNVIGTTIVFWLARKLGGPVFEENVSARARLRYNAILENRTVLLWFIYAIPLVPVDVLSILAGLSRIRPRRFFLIAHTGYISYTAIVAYAGSSLAEFLGVTQAISILGTVFFLGLVWWVWRGSRRAALERRSRQSTPVL
jgi:uncharacterized membrane protein YdjX (TVP38/TMEM64 family)